MYILNGEVCENQEQTITPTSQAFMFGYGLFETLKVLNGKILFFNEHFKRLEEGCETLKLSLKADKSNILEDSYKLLELQNIKDGVLKVLLAKNNDENYLLLTTRENSYNKEDYERGFKLMFSEFRRNEDSILTYIKSNNYMENLLAKEISKDLGFDEVIFLNSKGHIAEGAVCNIFWIKNNIVYTPSVECGLLEGIVRAKVLESIEKLSLNLKVGEFTKEDILKSDEVFITNSVMDIMSVCQIEETTFSLEKSSVTSKIIEKYNMLIGEDNEG